MPLVGPVHAYSYVNTFSSAAMVYAVYGNPRYLNICVNAYAVLQRTQCYTTGGYGPDDRFDELIRGLNAGDERAAKELHDLEYWKELSVRTPVDRRRSAGRSG